jgi:hypothetical protein
VLALLLVCVIMLAAALRGSPAIFAAGTVALLGLLAGLAFVRRHDRVTWVPPAAAILVLSVAMTGLFLEQATPVHTVSDTVAGFQAGTAFLIYGIWIPAFFTLGLGFAIVFDRLDPPRSREDEL